MRKERTMGVRFNVNVTAKVLAAGMLISGGLVLLSGASFADEQSANSKVERKLDNFSTADDLGYIFGVAAAGLPTEAVQKPIATTTTTTTTTTTAPPVSDQAKAHFSAAVITEEPEKEVATATKTPESAEDCSQWKDLALEVGWPAEEWDRLNYVIWRESRCLPDVHNGLDPAGGSRGLIQINGFWCRKNQYTDYGYLQDNNVLETCEDLFDPRVNLAAGLAIWKYGEDRSGCGWSPWATRSTRWC